MPRYDYECSACEYAEEVFQSFNDEALTKCPSCKKKKYRRVISADALCVKLKPSIKEVKTIGQAIERNEKKWGKELTELKREKESPKKKKPRKKPWYGELPKEAAAKVLNSKEKAEKYIQTGEV